MENVLCKIDSKETESLKKMVERKLGLVTLSDKIQSTNDELFEEVVTELGEVEFKISAWWQQIGVKYGLQREPGTRVKVKYETNEIIIIQPSVCR